MTIGTGGTSAATSLTALKHPGSFQRQDGVNFSFVESDADIATINNSLKDDLNFNMPAPGAGAMWGYSRNGLLFVPNRGVLKVLPGDCVMVDANGWPILVSGRSIAGAPWVTTAT
jgi:hypothetical protein